MKKLTTGEFIEKAIAKHGDTYDYSEINYVNSRTKITIVCFIHGDFDQLPTNHLSGQNCPKCGEIARSKSQTKNTDWFLEKAEKVHGNRYDYGKVNYVHSQTKVIITCQIHSDFEQIPADHLRGYGCKQCANEVSGLEFTTENFIKKAQFIHKNEDNTPKFDYNECKYRGSKEKVCIICPIHGEFWQQASDHLNGNGCNQCRLNRSSENKRIINKKELREYGIWGGMKTRTSNPNTADSSRYIERGITCCDRWKNSFEDFYADMGPCPEGYTLDRIDNDLGYFSENCRWASMGTQAKNRGSFNLLFTHNGETKVLKDWAKEFNINYGTLYGRIYRSGLSFEKAIQKDPFSRLITLNGKEHTLKEWCIFYNIKYQTVVNRIHKHK